MIKTKHHLLILALSVGLLVAENPFDTLEIEAPKPYSSVTQIPQKTPRDMISNPEIFIQVREDFLQGDKDLSKHSVMLQNLYQQRQGKALWLKGSRLKGQKIQSLFRQIDHDLTLGYQSRIIKKRKKLANELTRKHTQEGLIALELQLSSLYYDFLHHTIYGAIDWRGFQAQLKNLESQGIHANWVRYPLKLDILKLLSEESISQTINQVTPKGYGYYQLREALTHLYRIKWHGGWQKLPAFKSLKIGNRSQIVTKLRERLRISGDYRVCSQNANNSTLFDRCLESAVKRFQRRHQIKADGVVGKETQKLLNISVGEKIRKVKLNLDRIKWLPREKANRYVMVNIPEYMLYYIENAQTSKRLKVIVGDPKHPTPIFSNEISYIVLNPYWKVPEGIVRKEIVPEMIKNPNYLKTQGLEAHETWEENSSIMPLDRIVWSDYLDPNNKFPYRLMQPPGARNALGKIKFKFPNRFSVYLHDTPTKHLFGREKRAFSHGCIRLSKPLSLLEAMMQNDPEISPSKTKQILASKKKKQFYIKEKIPIHLIYLTTWVNPNHELTFGDDVYHYDQYQRRIIQ